MTKGQWKLGFEEIQKVAMLYFEDLFTMSSPIHIEGALTGLESHFSKEENEFLSMPFTALEVKEAIYHMGATKSPDLDDMPVYFYQKYWHIMGMTLSKQC